MAFLFNWGHLEATSLAMGGGKVVKNQSRKILSSSWILHKLRHRCHSWMWSAICVIVLWRQDNNISTPLSYLMGSWKYYRNMKARELKSGYLACVSSMYHLAAAPVRVRWKNLSVIESSTMLFDEHHRWNVMMWFWDTPLPSLQTWECLREVLLAWEAKRFDDRWGRLSIEPNQES